MNNKLQYWIELNRVKLFYKKIKGLNKRVGEQEEEEVEIKKGI